MIGEGEIREWALSFYLKHAGASAAGACAAGACACASVCSA